MADYLNESELAAKIKISKRTLRRWRTSLKGPAFIKIEGSVRYSTDEVEKYIAEAKPLLDGGNSDRSSEDEFEYLVRSDGSRASWVFFRDSEIVLDAELCDEYSRYVGPWMCTFLQHNRQIKNRYDIRKSDKLILWLWGSCQDAVVQQFLDTKLYWPDLMLFGISDWLAAELNCRGLWLHEAVQ